MRIISRKDEDKCLRYIADLQLMVNGLKNAPTELLFGACEKLADMSGIIGGAAGPLKVLEIISAESGQDSEGLK